MERNICEFCGMEFDASQTQCPICGRAVIHPIPALKDEDLPKPQKSVKGGAFSAAGKKKKQSENPYSVPKWVMVTICTVLSVICLAGIVFGIYNVGYAWEPISMLEVFGLKLPQPTTESVDPAEFSQTPSMEQYINEEDIEQTPEPQPEEQKVVLCTGITLGKNSITFEEAESFDNLTYVLEPADCTEPVQFISANESIATVNDNGKVVAISSGSTEITVSCGSQTAGCLVTCDFQLAAGEEPPVLPPQLNSEDITFFAPGEQFAFTVSNIDENTAVTYESSRPNVASVSENGVVTAMGIGEATVTATVMLDEPVKLSCIVRCNLSAVAETVEGGGGNCTISHSDVTMSIVGEYFKLTLEDENGDRIKGISWVSGNSSVCSVDSDGIVCAVGSGTTTVSTVYGGVSYQCIVRCNIG